MRIKNEIWIAAGLRTPFAKAEKELKNVSALDMSKEVLNKMAEKAKAEGNNFVKKLLSSNLTWSIVAFILLVIICTIFQHDFLALSWNSNTGGLAGPLITMLQESARYLMIATGMTLVISTAGIDLSVGSVMAVAGAAAMQTLSNGMNVWLSILIALAVGFAVGYVVRRREAEA